MLYVPGTGILCLMRLWYKKGSIMLRTGITIPGMKSRSGKYLPGTYKIELESESDDWKCIYTRTIVSQIPKKSNYLDVGIWNQLSSDNSWRPRINKLSTKCTKLFSHKNMVVGYDCSPIRGRQFLASGLGFEEGKRPDHVWSCVGPDARTKFIRLEPLMV